MHHGAGAHRARFNCSKQVALFQAVVTNGCTGLAQGNDLGMGAGVGVCEIAVPAAAHNLTVIYHDRAYWHLPGIQRSLGGAESFLHPEFVGVGRRLFALGHELIVAG